MAQTSTDLEKLTDPEAYTWRPLAILGAYRIVIVGLIAVLFFGTLGTGFFRTAEPGVFQAVLLAYFAFAAVFYGLIKSKWPGFLLQVYLQLGLDIIAITHLILASGTLGNGLGALMAVAIAGCSILVSVRTATFFAALASLLLLGTQVLAHLQRGAPSVDYGQVGFLGITIFATALLVSLLARRARHNQALADQRRADIESLEALNAHIVQAMHSGVVAIDGERRVRLMNAAAWDLLGHPLQTRGSLLADVCPAVEEALAGAQSAGSTEVSVQANGRELALRLRGLHAGGSPGTLIFLNDSAALRAQVQEAKLASIGRLTANVAHEVRNPLGAMMHAAQLLEESTSLDSADRRLTEIIRKQGARLNRVVENVLQLSRRQAPSRAIIVLQDWLTAFVRDFQEQYPQRDAYQLEIRVEPPDLAVQFDPDHLHQILTNLCRNAVQHGRTDQPLHIALRAHRRQDGRGVLEIADNGKGLAPEAATRLFEPFFTTSASGTGLGLYLCEELCAANHAHLTPVPTHGGACFQISFASLGEEAISA